MSINKNTSIVEISYQQTLDLRSRILKPHLKIEDCTNPGDFRQGSFHLGVLDLAINKIVGVASFEIESHSEFVAKKSYRLRGMATDLTHRGMGLGRLLVQRGQSIIVDRHGDFLWFNARVGAFPFYESLGFKFWGEFFELPHIGPHKVMYKYLGEPIN